MAMLRKDEKMAVRSLLETGDLTAFCRTMRLHGITNQSAIMHLIDRTYSDRYLRRFHTSSWEIAYGKIRHDLDEKTPTHVSAEYENEWTEIKAMSARTGSYKKILVPAYDGWIYWASPIYGLSDYNSTVWKANTPENRKKAALINKYLSNRCSRTNGSL